MQQNDQGKVFPVWGTCLGLQLLSYLTADYKNVLSPVRGETALLNTIKFTDTKGYLFETMPDRLIQKLTTGQGITYFNHHYAVLSSTYDNNRKLSDFWKITA
jgi:gamma-glutamyl hydrolase